jgi:hypothetical protein
VVGHQQEVYNIQAALGTVRAVLSVVEDDTVNTKRTYHNKSILINFQMMIFRY